MTQDELARYLRTEGYKLLNGKKKEIEFSGIQAADKLLNDIERTPHFFVLGCVMDRRVQAERAWAIPYRISQGIGGTAFDKFADLDLADLKGMFKEKGLHFLINDMPVFFHRAVEIIRDRYDGDASLIWSGSPPSADVAAQFLDFSGIGPKISSMATNILARDFKVPMADYSGIDVSPDDQVMRVFPRMGFVNADPTIRDIITAGRRVNPEYPGIIDSVCWEIGREYCSPSKPRCDDCPVDRWCPKLTG